MIQKNRKNLLIVSAFITVLFFGCAGSPTGTTSTVVNTTPGALTAQAETAANLVGARVSFNFTDYYTLTAPQPFSGCAGDARNFYDPFSHTRLATSLVDSTTTIRPSFLKNVSVDLTDSNSKLGTNKAVGCSFGQAATAPPISQCATFDYGAIGGISASLGGSLLLFGGLKSENTADFSVSCGAFSSTSSCLPSAFALGVNTLPSTTPAGDASLTPGLDPAATASKDPISTWVNLTPSASSEIAPRGSAGASVIFDSRIQKVLLFGGSSPVKTPSFGSSGPNATDFGLSTLESWTFDTQKQTWSHVPFESAYLSARLIITKDKDTTNPTKPEIRPLTRPTGGRALFGYAAVPGMALDHLSSDGSVASTQVDTTDRIITVGGYGNCDNGTCADTHRFNPTYGPEYFDVHSPASPLNPLPTLTPALPTQWIDSSPIQIISNSNLNSLFLAKQLPTPFPIPTPSPPGVPVDFGMVGLSNNSITSGGVGPSAGEIPGAGYLLTAGGFYGYDNTSGLTGAQVNTSTGTTCGGTANTKCGGMQFGTKWRGGAGSLRTSETELSASNFSSVTNYLGDGTQSTPLQWIPVAQSVDSTPFFGGGVLLPGLNLTADTNEIVFFGGSSCKDYLTRTAVCPNWPAIGNAGLYLRMGLDPASDPKITPMPIPTMTPNPTPLMPGAVVLMDGTVPVNAGMAAARGTFSDNPLIVAWGGMTSVETFENQNTIHYLYNNTTTVKPTWATVTTSGGPAFGLSNASLVFSHVTEKFYLFGGTSVRNRGSSAETWELTLTSRSCVKAATSSCTFTWKALTTKAGLTCYPNCPEARHSHRVVEANYHYFNAPKEPSCTDAAHPCSFGIFMEGGIRSGSSSKDRVFFADRWMFDPTANNYNGHWQKVGDFPPRVLASMASVDYQPIDSAAPAHRAILFGGETGMQNPGPNKFFIPPTLGDTWMYDFDKSTWNLVNLFGQRYGTLPTTSNPAFDTQDARGSSIVSDVSTRTLAPPPTSGGIMVTRTVYRSNHDPNDVPKTLAIPEVFFMGGRKKDGRYNLLNSVYKFCAGSSGEKPVTASYNGAIIKNPDDASCDAFDSVTNPNSPNPTSAYRGRWLFKSPSSTTVDFDPGTVGSYLGAGTYDSSHDLIVLFGGFRPLNLAYVTGPATEPGFRTAEATQSPFLEYTPPSAVAGGATTVAFNGSWAAIPFCAESPRPLPSGRYGHSLSYDPLNRSLIIVGGYETQGTPLTQSQRSRDGRTYLMPEVWTATRIDHELPSGIPNQNIPAITSGTYPCYYSAPVTVFGNSIENSPTNGLAHAASAFIPSSGYNTGYYTTSDQSCTNTGPIASADPTLSRLLSGGAYFDLDRGQLGERENLVLNLTIFPLSTHQTRPDHSYLTESEAAVFKVHLVKTGESGDLIRQRPQPRHLTYSATDQYPEIAKNIATITAPSGQIRQEQIFIPLGMDPTIDRIRIERVSGNAILIDASLHRLGKAQ